MYRQKLVGVAFIIAVLGIGSLAVLSTGGSDTVPVTETTATSNVDATAPGGAALRAYLDPETGEIAVGLAPAGAPELDPDTQNALRRDDDGLVQVHHADGSVSMDLQGRYQNVSIAHRNADGTFTVCTDNTESVKQALDGSAVDHTPEVK
ncbi:MAG: hypothetical protein L0Z51_04285 [Candidatus Latescibacteria bacterium]|nr:hypothetical protein [Candidatus Latescibacterota bacterium]